MPTTKKEQTPQGVIKAYYWIKYDNTVQYDYVDHIQDDRVEFTDGGWNPLQDCCLTEEQCRAAHGRISKEHDKRLTSALQQLDRGMTSIEQSFEKIRKILNELREGSDS